jgi:DNA (cytosine-5)-methyltransferase 1
MDLGFVNAGYRVVWANDVWGDAVKTYRLNLGDHIIQGDIDSISSSEVPDADIVIGGFPCQGFSVANRKRSTKDERNRLYLQFLRVVRDKRPHFFVAENVKGILSLAGGNVFSMILADFRGAGYRMRHAVLNAADYGVPQRRERVFIFGIREDCDTECPFPPKATHAPFELATLSGLAPWVGVGAALRNIPEPEESHDLANHHYTKYKLRFNGYLGHRIIDPDVPCPTITARGDERGGVVIHHHPSNRRRLSAREAAIIQSFPSSYAFFGSKTSVYRQVANAVPPLLAQRIAECLLASHVPADRHEVLVEETC